MASAQKSFHLRWNNHLQNLQNLFENLYNEQSLVDVTLSCSDGLLYGHKLVLSACSPYFERVLRDNPCKHPIMILKGIKQSDMQKLLEYMYVGAIDVIEEDLEKLLDTATDLQIKGLATSNRKNNLDRTLKPEKQTRCTARSPSPKQQKAMEGNRWEVQAVLADCGQSQNESNVVHDKNIKVESNSADSAGESSDQLKQTDKREQNQAPKFQNEFNQNIIKEEYIDNGSVGSCDKDLSQVESIDESYDEQMDQTENVEMNFDNSGILKTPEFTSHSVDMPYFCHLCSRSFDKKGSLQRHMLTHAGVKPHNCTFCELSFLRLSHLQRHIRVHTGERPYACTKCPKQFSRSDKLRQHNILTHHESNSRSSKPRGRPRKLVGFDGFENPFATDPVAIPRIQIPQRPQTVVVKGKRPRGRPRKVDLTPKPVVVKKPRGRPRKNPEFYPPVSPPSTSYADVSLNTLYPVTISPVQLNSTI